jgi:hypothetical protein
VNERVIVPASGDGSGDSEMNVRVNGGAHPSRREPTTRPPESPELRSGLHRALSPLRADTVRWIGTHWLVHWRLQEGHEFRKRGRVLEQEQVPTFVPA